MEFQARLSGELRLGQAWQWALPWPGLSKLLEPLPRTTARVRVLSLGFRSSSVIILLPPLPFPAWVLGLTRGVVLVVFVILLLSLRDSCSCCHSGVSASKLWLYFDRTQQMHPICFGGWLYGCLDFDAMFFLRGPSLFRLGLIMLISARSEATLARA